MSVGGGHWTARYATLRKPFKMSGRSVRRYRCQGGLQACTHPDFLYDAHTQTHRVAQKSAEKGHAQKVNQRTAIGNWIEQNEWIGRALSCASVLLRRCRIPHARRREDDDNDKWCCNSVGRRSLDCNLEEVIYLKERTERESWW